MKITYQLTPERKDAADARDVLLSWLKWSKEFSGDLNASRPTLVYRGAVSGRRAIRMSLQFHQGAEGGFCSATAHWFGWRMWIGSAAIVAIAGHFYLPSQFIVVLGFAVLSPLLDLLTWR